MTKKVVMVLSDRFKTRFMQYADMFEPFKVVVAPALEVPVVDDYGDKNIEALKEQLEKEPYDLVAIYDSEKVYYRNPDVKVLSDGQKWWLLDDVLPKAKETPKKRSKRVNRNKGK